MRIRTVKPGYKKKAIPQAVRRAVALRYGAIPGKTTEAKCENCPNTGSIFWPIRFRGDRPGFWVNFKGLELDHVRPEFLGGKAIESNMQLLCRRCNRTKGHRYA